MATNCRMVAELRCVIWALEGLHHSWWRRVTIEMDNNTVIMAILTPNDWPRYRNLLDKVWQLSRGFEVCEFQSIWTSTNTVARSIAKSVTWDGWFHSYITFGRLAWLHNQVRDGARSWDVDYIFDLFLVIWLHFLCFATFHYILIEVVRF